MKNTGMLSRNKKGQGMTEYIIVVALIAIGAIVMIGLFGDSVRASFNTAINYLQGNPNVRTERVDGSQAVRKDWTNYNTGQ